MKNFLITSLLITIIFVSGCSSLTSSTNTSKRDDFGCWPPSCSFIPDPTGQQFCNDWKAGKQVTWPPECSLFSQFPNCQKLCEFEKNASKTGSNGSINQGGYGGYPGSQQTQFGIPATDPNPDNVYIYISDFRHGRIVRMDDMTGKGLVSFGTNGSGINQFNNPNEMASDSKGRIYIADQGNNRIVRIDDITGKGWTEYSSGLLSVYSVAVDSKDRIYIANQNPGMVVRIDDMTGSGRITFGNNNLFSIKAVDLDSQDKIYISDKCNYRIIRFDDMTGKNRVDFQSNGTGKESDAHCGGTDLSISGSGVGQFRHELGGIAIDSQGRIYVADEHNNRIVRIDDMTGKGWTEFSVPQGSSDLSPAPEGNVDQGKIMDSKRLDFPHDIKISKSGRIYIANTRHNGIARIDDMSGKGWISYAPYTNLNDGTGPHTQFEATKGVLVVEKQP